MSVYIGDVQTFAGVIADKPQVLKVIEESAEVFSAWERLRVFDSDEVKGRLVEEIADTIQACANLLAAIGVNDMRQPMQACYVRNVERGREYSSSDQLTDDSADAQQDSIRTRPISNGTCPIDDMDNVINVKKCPNDSREQLEADVRDWAITTNAVFPENRVKSVKGFLDRQAEITYSIDAWYIEKLENDCDELLDQVDSLTAERDTWRNRFDKANREKCDLQSRGEQQRLNNLLNRLREKGVVVNWDDSRSDYMVLLNNCDTANELKAENEALKACIESLRSKLSKMLDAASEIQHIGDLP